MTLTNTVVAKLAVAFVAISMVFFAFAPAQAQTAEELQATIDALMAQINELNAEMGVAGGSSAASSASVCPYTWTRSLSTGDTGADVMALQQFLNSSADTQVSVSGAGAPGMETDYFGPATAAAVMNFQVKYRTDILSPVGLVNPVPHFGPSTMAKANMLCVAAPVVDDTADDTADDTMDDAADDSADDSLSGGEADINSMQGRDEEDAIREGEEDVAVHRVEFDVDDGDVMLKRVDVVLDASALVGNNGEPDPWDAFDEVSIWVDGDKVASEDVTDEDDWDDLGSDAYSFRLSGLDTIFRENTSPEVIIALSAANNVDVDGGSGNDDWDVYVDTDGMRFVDSEGIDTTAGPGSSDKSTFAMEEAGAGDDLNLVISDDDPDAQTYAVDENDNTDHLIFAFELDADDSDNDVKLDNLISIQVLAGGTDGTSLNAFVDDFYIEVDGTQFDAESYTGTGKAATVDFDINGDVTIDNGAAATVMVYATINDVASTFSDATLIASTSAAQIDAEGADDITVDGADVEGNTHTFRLTGVGVDSVDDNTTLDDGLDSTTADDEIDFKLGFDVRAFGDTIYLPFGATSTTDLDSGFEYSILDTNGSVVSTGTTSLNSFSGPSSDRKTNSYKIAEDGTVSFTVSVSWNPPDGQEYRLHLDTVNFAVTDVATATDAQDVSDLDIETGDYSN